MADSSGDRSRFFPAIETKHGEPISKWIARVRDLGDAKYADQLALLENEFGFSKAHAHAALFTLTGLEVNKRTFTVPIGWKGDVAFLRRMVKAQLAEIG